MDQQEDRTEIRVVLINLKSEAIGICAFIFGILSMYKLTILLMPISLVLAAMAWTKNQRVWAICAIIACVIAFLTSPKILFMLGMRRFLY